MQNKIKRLYNQGYSPVAIYQILAGQISIEAIEDVCINCAVAS